MRATTAVLSVLLLTVTAHATEDVQDVRLRLQNLGRADGKQAATLTGRTAPRATTDAVTATLAIGDYTVSLGGRVTRTGRLRLVGRRLALASALAAFERIDVTITGGLATALAIAAGDCVAGSRGRRLDCVESAFPPGALPDGAYDLTFTDRTPPGTTEVGFLTTAPDGRRSLRLYDGALDEAFLTLETDGALTGFHVTGGDFLHQVAGSATDQSTLDVARLIGGYTGTTVGSFALLMERAAAGTPSSLGGAWNLSFAGHGFMPFSGTALLDSTVPADGDAAAAPMTLARTGGSTAYTTNAGGCDVAPAGGLHCQWPIASPPGAGSVYLHGMLDAGAGSGQGTFAIGAAPFIHSEGTWTATR
jgi:hypothetical protein